MALEKKARGQLKTEIRALVLQEVRLSRYEQTCTLSMMMDEMNRSIQDEKREIVRLTRRMDSQERAKLLRRMIEQAIDEEIDQSIQIRRNRCLRCVHKRFYDRSETAYLNLPLDEKLAQTIGCDKYRNVLQKSCRRFVETSTAHSLEDYLGEVTLLYEFRERIEQIEDMWKDYLTK